MGNLILARHKTPVARYTAILQSAVSMVKRVPPVMVHLLWLVLFLFLAVGEYLDGTDVLVCRVTQATQVHKARHF
jgi:hypothetical protein